MHCFCPLPFTFIPSHSFITLAMITLLPHLFPAAVHLLFVVIVSASVLLVILSQCCCFAMILLFVQSVPIIEGEMGGKRTHQMYLPFLVISCIQLAFTIIGGIVMFFTLDQMRQQMGGYSTGVIIGYFFGLLLVLLIFCWCYSIVFRAYKFVKEKNDEKIGHNAKKDIQI